MSTGVLRGTVFALTSATVMADRRSSPNPWRLRLYRRHRRKLDLRDIIRRVMAVQFGTACLQ